VSGKAELEIARRIYADWERGVFDSTWWIDPEIVWEVAGPLGDSGRGPESLADAWRELLGTAAGLSILPQRFFAGDYGVLVIGRFGGSGRVSGIPWGLDNESASLFEFTDGLVSRLVLWRNAADAFATLGLEPGDESAPA
jgi:hypothetical protein